jgi:hypothetical protein
MRKTIVGVTILALVLSLGVVAMASDSPNDDLFQKNYELKKDFINQQLERGLITQDQANYSLERLEEMNKYYEEYGNEFSQENGTYQGRGPCSMGAGFGPMMQGPGMMRGYGQGQGFGYGYGPGMGRGMNRGRW